MKNRELTGNFIKKSALQQSHRAYVATAQSLMVKFPKAQNRELSPSQLGIWFAEQGRNCTLSVLFREETAGRFRCAL
jgi:hypothetical protein